MSTCPGCGAEIEFSAEEVRVSTGTCGSCHKVTTFIEGALPVGTPTAGGAAGSTEEGEEGGNSGLECSDCGTPLQVTPDRDGSLQVSCPECETVARFVPEATARAARPDRDDDDGDRPRAPRGPSRDAGPSARPCRQCGAPLRFTTDANGFVTGECASCGNRFTLPPRRDRDRPGPERFRRRPSGSNDRPRRGWSEGGSGYRRGPDRRSRTDRESPSDDERRRRRRRE